MSDDWWEEELEDEEFSSPRANIPWYWIAAGLVLIVIFVIVIFGPNIGLVSKGTQIYIDYKNSKGLVEGAPLIFRGIQIGEVNQISLSGSESVRVGVVIYPENHELLTKMTSFRLIGEPGSQVSSTFVQAEVIVEDSPLITEGDVFLGADNVAENYWQKLENITIDGIEDLLTLGAIDVNTQVDKDGNITQWIRLETGKWIPESLYSDIIPEGSGWKKETNETEDFREIIVSGEFSEPVDSAWSDSEITINIVKGFLWTEYYFQQTFEENDFHFVIIKEPVEESANTGELITKIGSCILIPESCPATLITELLSKLFNLVLSAIDDAISLSDILPVDKIPVSITLNMPGQLTEFEGIKISNSTSTKIFNGEEIKDGVIIKAKSRVLNTAPIVIGAIIVVLLIVGIFWFLVRGRKPTPLYSVEEDEYI